MHSFCKHCSDWGKIMYLINKHLQLSFNELKHSTIVSVYLSCPIYTWCVQWWFHTVLHLGARVIGLPLIHRFCVGKIMIPLLSHYSLFMDLLSRSHSFDILKKWKTAIQHVYFRWLPKLLAISILNKDSGNTVGL